VTLSAPFRVIWDVTTRCNLNCRHCYNESGQGETLSPAQLHTIAQKLSQSGIFFITLSGGEPLMEPEIWEIIKQFKSNQKTLQLISNGTLITPRIAKKLKEYNVDSIQISIDGLEKTHDYQRQMKGCFKKSVNAIQYLVAEGIPVVVNTLVSQRNIDEIPGLIDLCVQVGVTEFRTSRLVLMGRGTDLEEEVLSPEKTKKLILYILEQRKTRKDIVISPDECMCFLGEKIHDYNLSWQGCPAGRTEGGVDAQGNVYPCIFMSCDEFNMGNLLKESFDDIWRSEKFDIIRNRQSVCQCDIVDFCKGGCPAAAYGQYKDITRKDPYCWRNNYE
jgi:radical SAM protein with 4Fe4S-binding SPASM domain